MVFSGLFLKDFEIKNLILIHVNYWNFKKSEIFKNSSHAVHMVSFENFVKLVSASLSELKVTPSFCFAFKIPEDVAASSGYIGWFWTKLSILGMYLDLKCFWLKGFKLLTSNSLFDLNCSQKKVPTQDIKLYIFLGVVLQVKRCPLQVLFSEF